MGRTWHFLVKIGFAGDMHRSVLAGAPVRARLVARTGVAGEKSIDPDTLAGDGSAKVAFAVSNC